ncbi:hypothetical protein HYV82_04340 [Candidatus Woesearchaeota archaeon]|nr:hypothetical protein [Candidatus Woesearchaeota archaeon]
MKRLILGVLLLSLIVLAGCSQTVVKYQCADGSFEDSANSCASVNCKTDCPKLDCASCPTKTEYQEKIVEKPVQVLKYQCADESVKDRLSDCPQIPEAKKISPVKEFNGVGDKVTDAFYLSKGFTKITSHYHGNSNFIVHLIDEDGDRESIHNEIRDYDGETAVTIRTAGNYRLEVKAQGWDSAGSWSIKLEQ